MGRKPVSEEHKAERKRAYNKKYYVANPEKWNTRGGSCGVYVIRNSATNKVYVGQSINVDQRWKMHLSTMRRKYPDLPSESWSFELMIKIPELPLDGCSSCHLAIESILLASLIRKGCAVLNKGWGLYPSWDEVEKYVLPHLTKFDEENQKKLVELIEAAYDKKVSPTPPS